MPPPNPRSLMFKNIIQNINKPTSEPEPEKENLPKASKSWQLISKTPSVEDKLLPLNENCNNVPKALPRTSSTSSLSSQSDKDFSPASDDDHAYNPPESNSSFSESSSDSPKQKQRFRNVIQESKSIVQPTICNLSLKPDTSGSSGSSSSTSGSSGSSDSSSESSSDSDSSASTTLAKPARFNSQNKEEKDCIRPRQTLTSLQHLALEYASNISSEEEDLHEKSANESCVSYAQIDDMQIEDFTHFDSHRQNSSPFNELPNNHILHIQQSSSGISCQFDSVPTDFNKNNFFEFAQEPVVIQDFKNPLPLKIIAMQALNSAINYESPALPPELTHESRDTNNVGKSRKRKRGVNKRELAKKRRNLGLSYLSTKSKSVVSERKMGAPCGQSCRLKCSDKISAEARTLIFNRFWMMGSLSQQRDYIAKHLKEIKPKYQYKKIDSNRKPKHSFSFTINNEKQRVCKIFFKNSLGITDRQIRTVTKKINENGIVEPELRGKHGKHNQVDPKLIDGVRRHINSIPRIESHYLRKQTTREFIEGGKNVTDLYLDYKNDCLENGQGYVKIHIYRKVFKEDFNISFFVPKKDQCDQCLMYQNAESAEKAKLEAAFKSHLEEKEKSREEKAKDKALIDENNIVACYDLQAQLPVPKGEASSFYYMSKLNCLNFTISELKMDHTECFFWNEVEGAKGANEIGSCVLRYLEKKSSMSSECQNIIFYSDNCCGQQKNQFMFSMYIYAVKNFTNLKSITHKFLIKGHTQNEGDAVHSTIEKEIKKMLKSGPIYVPDQYVNAIRQAKKKGQKYVVNEMCHSEFYDIKTLQEFKLSKNTEGDVVKITEIKVLKIEKSEGDAGNLKVFYKTSYLQDNFKEIKMQKYGRNRPQLKRLYATRLPLSERKKADLRSLISKKAIPPYYASSFYNNIL